MMEYRYIIGAVVLIGILINMRLAFKSAYNIESNDVELFNEDGDDA